MIRFQGSVATLVFFLTFASGLSADRSSDRQRDFLRSIELFDAAKSPEDFRESALLLESIVADGFCSGVVFYNLGNAYYRAGEFGRAISNYRKAKPYRPSDPLLEANLQQALASAPGKLPDLPRPWWDHVLFWTESIDYPTRVAIALSLLVLAPLIVLCACLFHRKNLIWLASAVTGVAVLFVTDAVLTSPENARMNRAVITGETVARKGIGKDYEAAFDSPLKDGAEFVVLQETNGWTFGRFSGIGDGWVRNEFVAK